MSEKNRIVWSEGLFLRPQHFQQQERYLENYIQGRVGTLRLDAWGLVELEIERDLLAIGKLALRRARGVFPDGTPFAMPDSDPLPPPLEIGTQL
ncbi:MAG: type VI secretion system baseplate subunit TssK, partial [Steroidobacteraceae bacterium]